MNNVEHLLHIFLDCSFSKACWRFMQLNFNAADVESCSEWLLQNLATVNQETMVKMVIVLYGIWTARNLRVWVDKLLRPEIVMQWSFT